MNKSARQKVGDLDRDSPFLEYSLYFMAAVLSVGIVMVLVS